MVFSLIQERINVVSIKAEENRHCQLCDGFYSRCRAPNYSLLPQWQLLKGVCLSCTAQESLWFKNLQLR